MCNEIGQSQRDKQVINLDEIPRAVTVKGTENRRVLVGLGGGENEKLSCYDNRVYILGRIKRSSLEL